MLCARYFPQASFLDAKEGVRPSYAWRSILSAHPLLNPRLRWFIRDNCKEDIREVFATADEDWILKILVKVGSVDVLGWHFDAKGWFSANSAYKVALSQQVASCSFSRELILKYGLFYWNFLRKTKAAPKVLFFT
ncbi:UNVERIFIED_CONTAM: hypothetical protein Slati_0464400 [Sesamum latifolium]|uniref:Uncharacterized protein n=1 Tax=Sesamum latifolium TaxID=2727402 RepID=A0AAW2XZF0_9LAMI